MSAKPYNGFTGQERSAAGRWYLAERRAGRRHSPVVCLACKRVGGSVAGHSEDYSAPFGDHIGAIGLCFPCHMAVHTRFSRPESFRWYAAMVRSGHQAIDCRVYGGFWGWFVRRDPSRLQKVNAPRPRTWLDTLAMTEREAAARHRRAA